MSKGGGSTRTITQTQQAPEYAQPYLEFGIQEAKRLYESPTPEYYPGSTVVGFSPETELALSGIRQQAMQGSPLVSGVQDVVMQNLMGTNPLQMAAFKPVIEATQGQLSKSGRYGSGYGQAAMAQALAPYAYQAQQAAIQQAPAARQFGMADFQTLAEVGAAREALQQAQLEADIQRFEFEQAKPAAKLADYIAAIQGGTVGGQTTTPVYRQPAAGFLGGGMGGAQIGQMIAGEGKAVNPLFALGGALLGGFGS